jgi:lysylphosphatidylglycerol synthetase-like protein (DUF2156 family)
MALSSQLSALWRRRVRLVVLVGLVLGVLYSGESSDVVRLVAAGVGLLAGRLLLGGAPRGYAPSRSETRLLVATLVAATALGPVVAAFSSARIGPLSVLQYVVLPPPPDAATVQQVCATPVVADDCAALQARLRLSGIGPALLSLVPVFLLLVLAEGLRRGRRAALRGAIAAHLALAALGAVLATTVLRTPAEKLVVFGGLAGGQFALATALPLVTPLAVAVVLVMTREQFTVRAPAGTYRRFVAIIGAALIAVSVVYLVGGTADPHGFDRPPDPALLVRSLPFRFVPPGYLAEVAPPFLPATIPATLLYEWTGVVFWLVVCAALLRTFLTAVAHSADADARRARALVEQDGGTLSWLATWPHNGYWFTPDGRAAVAYRVLGGVAITTGDPFGDPAARARSVAGFAAYCRQNGWTRCFYSVTDEVRVAAAAEGFRAVQVAEETVLELPGLAFTGKRFQDVRTALNKAAKAGITAEWLTFGHAPLALTDQVRAISEEWVAEKGLPEMGFTLGGLDELADDAVRCLVAVDASGTVHGVTSWLPVHRDRAVVGWTLDFMRRRDRDAFKGVMEFLIASAALRCKAEGAELLSLSGAPLARVDRGDQAGSVQQLLDAVGRALEPVYGFRSLLAFKAKFAPIYRPLYLLYDDPVALPAIAGAIGRAYLPALDARQGTRLARRLLR